MPSLLSRGAAKLVRLMVTSWSPVVPTEFIDVNSEDRSLDNTSIKVWNNYPTKGRI